MKLNYKRTILVGFAFFLICAFWQIYDVTIAGNTTMLYLYFGHDPEPLSHAPFVTGSTG